MTSVIPITDLNSGQSAVVAAMSGDREQVRRLHELGIRDGIEIQIVRAGNPCIAKINGHRVCFRPSDLLRVYVRRPAA